MRRQFGLLSSARILALSLQSIVLILLARYAGVQEFGIASIILAVESVIISIAGLGLVPYILRELPRRNFAEVKGALRLNLLSTAVGFAIAAASGLLLGAFHPGSTLLFSLVLAGSLALDKNNEVQLSVSISKGGSVGPASSYILRSLLHLCIFFILINTNYDPLLAFAFARLAGSFVANFVGLKLSRITDSAGAVRSLAVLRETRHLAVSNAIGAFRGLDVAMVSMSAGAGAAGFYSAASKLQLPVSTVVNSLSAVLMPRASVSSLEHSVKTVKSIRNYAFFATLPMLIMMFFTEPIVIFIYGAEFSHSAQPLNWLLLGLPAVCAAPLLATILQARSMERHVTLNTAIFTPVTLVAVAVGALLMGAAGGAFAFSLLTWVRVIRLILLTKRMP